MPDRAGQQLGNYQLLRLLGEGGFAEVYLGEHTHLGSQAAIKVLHTQLTSDAVEKFRAEARTIARLIHPHIVRVLEFGIEGKTPFLVMDYAPNGTLRQRHPKGAVLPLSLVATYVEQIADALQYAHDEKVIHRDVKPANMLLGRRNEILLSDFGIALVAQSSRYQSTQEMAGTIAYMAPEQIQGQPRPASDQYALGIVVYEWLTGDRPFHGSLTELVGQHLSVSPTSLREKVSTIFPEVDRIVQMALAKDPKQRFDTIQTFASALRDAVQPSPSAGTLSPTIEVPVGVADPSEPVSRPSSSLKPDTLVRDLMGTEYTPIEPVARTADIPPSIQSSPQKQYRTSTQLKSWRITLVLILLTLVLIGAGSFGVYNAIAGKWSVPQGQPISLIGSKSNQATTTAQANASATAHADSLGRTWHARTSGTSKDLFGVANSGSQFVVVGSQDTILTSSDGVTWTPRDSRTSHGLYRIAWSGSQFVAVGETALLTSTDGSTWTPRSFGANAWLYGIVWLASQFVAVGTGGTILTSPDGITWTSRSSGTPQILDDVGWSGSQFVAVGNWGTILTSPDGITWTSRSSGISQGLGAVCWSGSQFVAVGDAGTILTSPDGITWTPRSSSTSQGLSDVIWSGSQFVAVGWNGTILTSPDGITWTPRSSGTSQGLLGVTDSGSQFVVVGWNGTVLTSP